MARMGDKAQPAPAGKTYADYHVKRSTKNGGSSVDPGKHDSSGH